MSPAEVADLLRYCSALDPWLKQTSPEEGAVMVGGWATILAHVPADHAMRYAQVHYSQGNARTITPGDVLADYHDTVRAEQAAAEEAEVRELATVGAGDLLGGSGAAAYLRDLASAHAAGRDLSTVPRPATVRVLPVDADVRGRRCVYHALCACDHTRCRGGWSDDEAVVVNALGRSYPAVQRCLHCQDALIMAEERGVAKKPSRTAVRR